MSPSSGQNKIELKFPTIFSSWCLLPPLWIAAAPPAWSAVALMVLGWTSRSRSVTRQVEAAAAATAASSGGGGFNRSLLAFFQLLRVVLVGRPDPDTVPSTAAKALSSGGVFPWYTEQHDLVLLASRTPIAAARTSRLPYMGASLLLRLRSFLLGSISSKVLQFSIGFQA